MRISLWLCAAVLLALSTTCEYTELMEPLPPALCDTLNVSYDVQAKEIIDRSCAIPGCHRAGTKAPGDFSNYNSMKPFLKDTEFKFYVIDLKDDPDLGMPPNWDTNPGPKDLTDNELAILECWINQGYQE